MPQTCFNTASIKNLDTSDQLTLLRLGSLLLKIGLTFTAADTFGLSLTSSVVYLGLLLEISYVVITFSGRDLISRFKHNFFILLLIDTLFWIAWLYFTGGATNAFISLLLLPIAISVVVLPQWAPWSLTLLSSLAYSLMIFSGSDPHTMHHDMDMNSHYLGMWFNFLISALVLTTSMSYIAKRMLKQEVELSYMREAQLRQERLLALGTVSAQMAHQLATPLATLRLLVDEAVEDNHASPKAIHEMDSAMQRCEQSLNSLRMATESIREQRQNLLTISELINTLRQQVLLLMPEVTLALIDDEQARTKMTITADASLMPALLALVENAGRASLTHIGEAKVVLSAFLLADSQQLCISVKDFGTGISKEMQQQLGQQLIKSQHGMGMALLLSNASFEKLGGKLFLACADEGGTEAKVYLPLAQVSN